MSELINLRKARKQKQRADKDKESKANRTLHGQARAVRDSVRAATERHNRYLDGHLRETPPPGDLAKETQDKE
ncbi:DUF4169 family protein [Haematospirillum jordaniae]|uniref:Amidase n=1 Tax=Haematospirillum jordaniae TaxID=1549855 RepID=A0A143DD23_9PROT|nr:DUF4169 family protein [Haematospirillum jordaniae]AMW34018.1 hypothetical protein AY555_01225 [Haematospirillum jordaniae]NKD45355.1 DUF4169 family protein [Haematospirillum jordaniae]NKD57347.1 DUF4169 family protein [Haematospirillum jordaniae]NKD59701.1 DUF4169 family protein [Haematospirillum jordaniae]NKD67273.1 DUF4169 family protein [Haematospirillum jordaniae]